MALAASKIKPWEKIDSKKALDSKWFKVDQETVRLPNGLELDDYFVWQKGPVAHVVPVLDNGSFVMVRQYKHGLGQITIEFPAGFVDEGEDPFVAAQRELIEETGFSAKEWQPIAKFVDNPTKVRGWNYGYIATGLTIESGQNLDHTEEIEVLEIPQEQFIDLIHHGDIVTSSTISMYTYYRNLKPQA